MRRSRLATLLLLPALVLGLSAPSAATEVDHAESHRAEHRQSDKAEHRESEKAEHTEFYGVYFPAGMPDTGTVCPGIWMPPALCVIDPGSSSPSGNGLAIRDMTLYELAFAYRDEGEVEPRKTGYDIVLANANLDASGSGPTWGTWKLYSFDSQLMFTGRFFGRFKNGIPAVFFIGRGTGEYDGQRMRGYVNREMNADGYNMFGRIVEPRSRHHD